MIQRLNNSHNRKVIEYLHKEKEVNIFLLSDIERFGYDSYFFSIYGGIDENGEIKGILLKCFEFIIFYAYDEFNVDEFAKFINDSECEEMALEWEAVLRDFTRGGICRAFQIGEFSDCHHIDARSMYPTQCDMDYIPHGPVLRHPPKDKTYTTIHYPIGHFYLKEGKISGIQFRRKSQCFQYQWLKEYQPSEYVEDMYLDGTFPIWDAEYKIMLECFHCDDLTEAEPVYVEMVEKNSICWYVLVPS